MSNRKFAKKSEGRVADFVSLLWPRLMSIPTAARYLDTALWHVEELCRAGTIFAIKEGRRWAIDRLELDRYVDRRVENAVEDKATDAPANRDGNPYKTIKEAAAYLRSTPWFVAQKIRSGDLPYIKAAKKHVIALSDLNELFERMRQN